MPWIFYFTKHFDCFDFFQKNILIISLLSVLDIKKKCEMLKLKYHIGVIIDKLSWWWNYIWLIKKVIWGSAYQIQMHKTQEWMLKGIFFLWSSREEKLWKDRQNCYNLWMNVGHFRKCSDNMYFEKFEA